MKTRQLPVYIFPLLFLILMLFIYIPSWMFLSNIDEFAIEYYQILPCILIPGAIAFILGSAVFFVLRKKKKATAVLAALVFGIAIAAYIQFNFLNRTLQQLNGAEIVWDRFSTGAIVSLAVWILCLAVPVVLQFVFPDFGKSMVKFGSMLFSVFLVISLILVFVSTKRSNDANTYLLSKDREFEVSSRENVVVFVADTLDAQWAEQYVNSNPETADCLDGFTYYDNVVAGGAPTILGIPAMLTGELYNPATSMESFYQEAYSKSMLFQDLQKKDYAIKLYTTSSLIVGTDLKLIENAVVGQAYRIKDNVQFTKSLLQLTAYQAAPYQLKSNLEIYSGRLTSNVESRDSENPVYTLNDPQFYLDFQKDGLKVRGDKGVFVLYHLFGAHGPYTMNEEARAVSEGESSLEQQIQGTMKIICEYLEQLKQKNLYDNSTIIITADHGGVDLYQNPAVYIKKRGERGGLKSSSAPLTFKNLRASFVEEIVDDYSAVYGEAMDDVDEHAPVSARKHIVDPILRKNLYPDDGIIRTIYLSYDIGNPARDNSQIIEDTEGTRNQYTLGERIELFGKSVSESFYLEGFSTPEDNFRWINGTKARIPLTVQEGAGDLTLSFEYNTFNGTQHAIIYANEERIFDGELDGGTLSNIAIPQSCIRDGNLDIIFEMPDAKSPREIGLSMDERLLSISIRAFRIDRGTEQ